MEALGEPMPSLTFLALVRAGSVGQGPASLAALRATRERLAEEVLIQEMALMALGALALSSAMLLCAARFAT